MTFYTYMIRNYHGTDGPQGDLASDMYLDKDNFPRNGKGKFDGWHMLILNYLEKHHACNDCIEVFEESWREYETVERKRLGMKPKDEEE